MPPIQEVAPPLTAQEESQDEDNPVQDTAETGIAGIPSLLVFYLLLLVILRYLV